MRSGIGAVSASVAVAILLAGSVAALAQGAGDRKVSREQFALQIGQQKYMQYCATCHGPNATGDGVAAGLFTKRPPDLTLLTKNNGGKFPMNKVLNVVKGDAPIAAHGNREMPVWGEILGRPLDTSMTGKAAADAEILVIVSYLESIQKK
jgi:mono/diheme cytochrome c family protein